MNLNLSSASSSQDKGLSHAFQVYPIDVIGDVPFLRLFLLLLVKLIGLPVLLLTFSSHSCDARDLRWRTWLLLASIRGDGAPGLGGVSADQMLVNPLPRARAGLPQA